MNLRHKIISLVAAVAILAVAIPFVQADMLGPMRDAMSTYLFTVITNIPAETTSFTWTNTVTDPWRFGSCTFRLAPYNTNDFTVDQIRVEEHLWRKGWIVETNAFGTVETNYYPSITNITYDYTTNNLLSDSTTNMQSVIYEESDFPQYKYVLPGDVLIFSWSFTNNSFYLFWDAMR